MALVRQPKTVVFKAEIDVRIHRRPALKVLTLTLPMASHFMSD